MRIGEWHEKVYKTNLDLASGLEQAEWRLLRDEILRRDNWTCQRCDKKFRYKRYLTVHHIVSRANGGGNNPENLITLCCPCHDYVETHELISRAAIVGSLEDNEIIGLQSTDEIKDEEPDPYNRPEWHKYVYGGCRRNSRI